MTKILPPAPSLLSDKDAVASRLQTAALYGFLVDSLTEYAVFAVSPAGIVISWNSGAQAIFGYAHSEIVGRSFEIIFTDADKLAGAPKAELDSGRQGGAAHHDCWHVRKDGSRFWGINSVQPLRDQSGELLGFTKLVRDMTASHLADAELQDSEQELRLLIESVTGFAIFSLAPDGTIKTWSAGAQSVFGYRQADVVGRNFAILFPPDDAAKGAPLAELAAAARRDSIDVERWLVRKDGVPFLASGKMSQLKSGASGQSRGFVKLVHDTTKAHLAAQEVLRRAQYDSLTQLPNRQTFYEHVQRAISILKRRRSHPFAVLFIDLDHFKDVNDEFGHVIADQVLHRIARRLEKCIRAEDIVARLGGDEFAILLNGIELPTDVDDAAQRILTTMREAVQTDAGDVFAAVSIGTAIGTALYDRPEQVLRDADAAMYVAKTRGRGRAVIFDEVIAAAVRDNIDLTTALRHATERGELRIAYQPIFRLADRKLVGFESLVRWKHPRRGLIFPAQFISQAEDSNLIIAIDRWMLTESCNQLARWHARSLAPAEVSMSVNVSSKEFSRDSFAAELKHIIDASGIAPSRLRLEITEGTMLERAPRAYEMLATVREFGVHVDVDDFGTGYASLGALNHIFVDGLKVDWSFVTSNDARHGWDIVESVIALAHKLGLIATAEGIETSEQLDRLIALGCDYGQGYLFAPALGAVAATALLRSGPDA